MDDFMPKMLENAKASMEDEAECHQFDVCRDEKRANAVFLYEVYTNSAAYDEHLKTSHCKAFDASANAMIESKQIQTFTRVMQ